MTRTVLPLVLFASLAAPLAVHAQQQNLSAADDARARQHFQIGADDFNTGDYESALDEFNHAFELSHRPQLYLNLSLCYEHLGNFPQAADYLGRYLDQVHDVAATERTNLESKLAIMRRRIAATTTTTTTAGTGTTPTGTTTTTGTGSTTTTSTTGTGSVTTGGSATTITGTGATTGGETTATTTTTGGETTSTTTGSTGTESQATTPPPSHGGGGIPTAALISWIAGGVGLLDFGIVGALALANYSTLTNASHCGAAMTCMDSDVSGQRTLNLVADIGLGVFAVGAILGTIFFFTMQSHDDTPPPSVAVAPWIAPRADGGGLSLAGRL